jgi:hypothetical protein
MVYDPKWDYKNNKAFGPGKSIPSKNGGYDNPHAVRSWYRGLEKTRQTRPNPPGYRERILSAYRKHLLAGAYSQPKNTTRGE